MTNTEPRSAGSGGGRDKTQPTPTELLALADEFDEVPLIYDECYDFVKSNRHTITTALRSLATTLSAREDGWQLLIDAAKQAERRLTYLNIQDGKAIDADLVLLLRKALAETSVPKAPTAGEGG